MLALPERKGRGKGNSFVERSPAASLARSDQDQELVGSGKHLPVMETRRESARRIHSEPPSPGPLLSSLKVRIVLPRSRPSPPCRLATWPNSPLDPTRITRFASRGIRMRKTCRSAAFRIHGSSPKVAARRRPPKRPVKHSVLFTSTTLLQRGFPQSDVPPSHLGRGPGKEVGIEIGRERERERHRDRSKLRDPCNRCIA